MLDCAQLTAMRATLAASLPSTCAIQRSNPAQSTVGEGVPDWETVASDVACRLSPAAGERMQDYGARQVPVGDWMLTVAWGTDIQAGDQVIMADGKTLAVAGVDEGRSWQLCRRAALVEVEVG